MPLPEKINFPEAGPLLCGGITVFSPLAMYAKPTDRVGIIGVGGLGHMAVKFAAAFGCEVTAFTSSEAKFEVESMPMLTPFGALTTTIGTQFHHAQIDSNGDAGSLLGSARTVIGAGYFYNQLSADSGSLAILGPVKSRVIGIGPQIGYLFPVGDMQGFLGVKGFYEFDAQNRPDGWNTWLTFQISPAAPRPRSRSQ